MVKPHSLTQKSIRCQLCPPSPPTTGQPSPTPSPETRQHVESSSCVNKNIRLIDVSYSALRRASNFQRDNLLLGRVRGCWEIERRERPRCQKTESSV